MEGNTRPTIDEQIAARDRKSQEEAHAMVEREEAKKPTIQRLIEKLINALGTRRDRWE